MAREENGAPRRSTHDEWLDWGESKILAIIVQQSFKNWWRGYVRRHEVQGESLLDNLTPKFQVLKPFPWRCGSSYTNDMNLCGALDRW